MKIYHSAQKLLVRDGQERQTDRQTGDLISLLSLLESRLIKYLTGKYGEMYAELLLQY
jgi:hypothetical protein